MQIDSSLSRRADARDDAVVAAFSVRLGRNLLIQALVTSMVALMGLSILPWPPVLAWTAIAAAAFLLEDRVLRLVAAGAGRGWTVCAASLRITVAAVYAIAAYGLISYGGPGERIFAITLIASSLVYILMRYYRTPMVFLASISPYVAILIILAVRLAREELAERDLLGAIGSAFTLVLFAILIWSARAQLTASWMALTKAREAAEDRNEQAERASRAKSHFLAAMSHELRTPLNGVLGMAQALANDKLTDVQLERVRIIRRSSETLLAVLNDLLDLSKIEASTLELEPVEFDLEHLVRGVAAAFAPGANKKGVAFESAISEDAHGRYIGDSARLRRVLYNLCANAVKFTETGSITLAVDRVGEDLRFRVTDTGIGIAPEHQAHLFEDFFQVDTSFSRKTAGAGMGLAICRQLTMLMGGAIEATSEIGRGSTFVVRVPLAAAAACVASGTRESTDGQPTELRILAAEDNETNQVVLRTLLAQAGITPTFVENGREALAAWEGQTWDIILMDIQMPEMDGVAATRAIRLREAETGRGRTPIVAVTANAMAHQVVEYEAAGMDGLVPKPVEISRLFAAMEAALIEPAAALDSVGASAA